MSESESAGPSRPRYLEAAEAYLERAVVADDAREAIRALEMVGRALLSLGRPRTVVAGGSGSSAGGPPGDRVGDPVGDRVGDLVGGRAGEDAAGQVGEGDVVTLPEAFAAALADHPGLIARAARSLGMFAEMDGAEAFPEMLYARSGYQVLVDAGVWPSHPVRVEHLAESDEEIVDAVAEVGVPDRDIPGWVPASHAWWPRLGRTGSG